MVNIGLSLGQRTYGSTFTRTNIGLGREHNHKRRLKLLTIY